MKQKALEVNFFHASEETDTIRSTGIQTDEKEYAVTSKDITIITTAAGEMFIYQGVMLLLMSKLDGHLATP